jgi:uncharacterized membrane protein
MAETSTKLEENVASLLCYVLGWITGIIFLILEPENKTVKFHAWQSIIVFGAITILGVIFSYIPFLRHFLNWVIWAIGLILWIVLMVKAYRGEKYKLPVSGEMAEKWAG